MSNSKSLLSYKDIQEALERALGTVNGIEVEFETEQSAIRWLSRCNSFRVLDRENNRHLYNEGHTYHGASAYDILLLRREGKKIVAIPRNVEQLKIKEL